MRARALCALVGAAAAATEGRLAAQSGNPDAELARVTAEWIRRSVRIATVDPSLTSPVLPPLLDLKVEASQKNKIAALLIGRDLPKQGSVHLKLSAPFDSADEQTELADLRGLTDTATVELGFKKIFSAFEPKFGPNFGPNWDAACKRHGLSPGCSWRELPRDERARLLSWSPPTLIGFVAQTGRKSFDWRDRSSLARESASHYLSSMTLAVGLFPLIGIDDPRRPLLAGLYYIGADARYEISYKNSSKTELCTPLGTTGALTCDDVFLGAPTKKTKGVAEIEVRKYFGASLLANPRLNWDFKSHVEGVELPLYFIKNTEGGLNGGVTVGWRSDTRAITASVFVGALADIWK